MGDKWSPLSDSCNLVAATSGRKSIDVSKSMCATSGGALVISLVLYLLIGFKYSSNTDISQITEYISQLDASFNMSILALLPLAFVIIMVILKFPILPVLFGGVVIGVLEAMIFQGQTLSQMLTTCWSGYVCDSGFEFVDTLFTRGGIVGTADLIMLFFAAVFFAGSAESIGIIDVIVQLLTKLIHTAGSLVAATVATCIGIVFLTSSDYTSIILNNRLYKETYKEIGLDGIVLSRTVAESTTTIGAICPWNSSAMVASAAMGVSAFAYAPLSFPTWISIILAIIFAFAGKFTPKVQGESSK
ncbi:Na+/H+ antiporter NhaC family protein [Lactonifactor longoviformis]|nr:Na+/H+ antiporter NhaC family protein [Lactonifactor longoviformis]